VVVDSAAIRVLYQEILSAAGASVAATHSPEEALTSCSARPPDLVLTDLSARPRGSVWLAHVMRSIPALASVPVITTRSGQHIDAYRDDFAAVLEHPFGAEELCEAVRVYAKRLPPGDGRGA
jgi:CheY-like chemotaxis protein